MKRYDSRQASAARTAQPNGRSMRVAKPVTVADHVEFGLNMLDPKEREQVQKAFSSWSRLRKLSKTAKPVGPTGAYLMADVSQHLYLVFRVSPDEAEVVDIMNKKAYELMRQTAPQRSSD
jgi:hypothetical protein